jgi:hypothetical protein
VIVNFMEEEYLGLIMKVGKLLSYSKVANEAVVVAGLKLS